MKSYKAFGCFVMSSQSAETFALDHTGCPKSLARSAVINVERATKMGNTVLKRLPLSLAVTSIGILT